MRPTDWPRQRIGLLAGISSAALFSTMALFARMAKSDFSTGQLILSRALIGILVFAWICRKEIPSLFTAEARPLWLRATFGGGSVACYFANIREVPLGVATILTDLAPIFVALFSILFWREKLNWRSLIGVALAFISVAILSNPLSLAHSATSLKGIIIGVTGALLGAWAYLSLKSASMKFSPSLVVLAFSIALAFVSLVDGAPLSYINPNVNFGPLIGMIVTSLLAQMLLTISYRSLSATMAATLGLTAVLWAMAFDVVFLETKITWTLAVATLGISAGVWLTQPRKATASLTSKKVSNNDRPRTAANE